jgi:hypothetical protein
LKLRYDKSLSNFAFSSNQHPYNADVRFHEKAKAFIAWLEEASESEEESDEDEE